MIEKERHREIETREGGRERKREIDGDRKLEREREGGGERGKERIRGGTYVSLWNDRQGD